MVIHQTMEWAWVQGTDMEDKWDRTQECQCRLITCTVNQITDMDIHKVRTLEDQEVHLKMATQHNKTIMVPTTAKCNNREEVHTEMLTIDSKCNNIRINNIHSNKELRAPILTSKEVQINSIKIKCKVLNNSSKEVRVQVVIIIHSFKRLLSTIKDSSQIQVILMVVKDLLLDNKEVQDLSSVITTTSFTDELRISNEI